MSTCRLTFIILILSDLCGLQKALEGVPLFLAVLDAHTRIVTVVLVGRDGALEVQKPFQTSICILNMVVVSKHGDTLWEGLEYFQPPVEALIEGLFAEERLLGHVFHLVSDANIYEGGENASEAKVEYLNFNKRTARLVEVINEKWHIDEGTEKPHLRGHNQDEVGEAHADDGGEVDGGGGAIVVDESKVVVCEGGQDRADKPRCEGKSAHRETESEHKRKDGPVNYSGR